MKIESLVITGFKSFRDELKIDLDELTAFIGSNGSGKTAVLEALTRLFSSTKSLRAIQSTDFHIPLNEKLEDQDERNLSIEVKLAFLELATGENTDAVSAVFGHMVVSEPDGKPYCRIRLEAKWINSAIQGGDIEEKIFWITTPNEIVDDKDKVSLNSSDRAKIQLHYIPATRNPEEHLKQTSSSIMHKLLLAIEWSDDLKAELQSMAETIKTKFQSETAISAIQTELTSIWNSLFRTDFYQSVNLSPFNSDFGKILMKTEIGFTPSTDGNEQTIERLSDGMKSLFYFTLIKTLFEIENKIISDAIDDLKMNRLNIPLFNIFAIEEPENHLAPHYLGRIMKVFRDISNSNRAQVLITSHTPTIIKRVDPEEIRHIRLDNNRLSVLSRIVLPEKRDEAFKYVKEAVKAYPELYFSKLVVFGEGDSEELVLAKIAEAHDVLVDQAFVSVVPLGGRFVNHFWKLLSQIGIPYVTLLDYDKERGLDGGFGRIKYVLNQLIKLGVDKNILLALSDGSILSDTDLENMHKRVSNGKEIAWMTMLERHNVYFSYPLDIDFMMLEKYPSAYKTFSKGQRGPIIPNVTDTDYEKKAQESIASVLKKTKKEDIEALDISSYPNHEYYFWYKYLFLGQGKPTSHLNALSQLSDKDLRDNCPEVLTKIIDNINTQMSNS
jgi:predicted ATP-dependent endonuclease of OLD family